MKKLAAFAFAFAVLALPLASTASAECRMGEKSNCCQHGSGSGKACGGKSWGRHSEGSHKCPLTSKFFKKAHFLLENKEALGLSDEQVNTIKSLKSDVKKQTIRQMAEMQVFNIDVKNKLSAPVLDVEGLNKMADDGAAAMAQSAKSLIASYAKLKGVLTPDQETKAMALWSSKGSDSKHSHS